MTWDNSTADADNGAGKIAWNHATIASATVLYVDDADDASADISAFVQSWDDATNTIAKGYVQVTKEGATGTYAVFKVNGAVTDASGYTKVPVAHIVSAGSFSDGDGVGVQFVQSGADGSGSMSNFILEDDSGDEVTIADAKEVKFIGSGITTNWTDTSDGSDGDPYDLTFTVDAAQTGVTSLFATDIKIGEDDETKIDFEDANTINFYADNEKQLILTDGALTGGADNILDLGSSGVEFKDAYFDGTVTSDAFAGPLTGDVTGNVSGTAATVTTAAQGNITSLGTLTTLSVDNITVNGNDISSTDTNGNITLTANGTGKIQFNDLAYIPQQAITSTSNAVAWDVQAKPNAYHLTTENTTFSAPTNAVEGAFICLEINFDDAHTIGWDTIFEFAASTEPTETATDGKTDLHVFRYNGAIWQEVGRTMNLSES
jgi:hypothetical protein